MSVCIANTVEVASGNRMELQAKNTEFGPPPEGDAGMLTFQAHGIPALPVASSHGM